MGETPLQPLVVREFEFSQTPEVYHVRPGQTLRAMMLETTQGHDLDQDIAVRVNGDFIPREYWHRLRPKPGTHIHAYRTTTLQGGSARQIVGMVAMIAVTWLTLGGGAIAGYSLGTATTAGTMAVQVGAYVLGSRTFPSLVLEPVA